MKIYGKFCKKVADYITHICKNSVIITKMLICNIILLTGTSFPVLASDKYKAGSLNENNNVIQEMSSLLQDISEISNGMYSVYPLQHNNLAIYIITSDSCDGDFEECNIYIYCSILPMFIGNERNFCNNTDMEYLFSFKGSVIEVSIDALGSECVIKTSKLCIR